MSPKLRAVQGAQDLRLLSTETLYMAPDESPHRSSMQKVLWNAFGIKLFGVWSPKKPEVAPGDVVLVFHCDVAKQEIAVAETHWPSQA